MEVRRSARVATEFLVAIQGLEIEPVLRRGNISTTGIYFVTDADVGEAGMMSWLSISSVDREKTIVVMAYVVRRVRLTDADEREITGVAFEFIPDNDTSPEALSEFVRYILALRREGSDPHVSARLDARIASDAPEAPVPDAPNTTVRELTIRSLVIETSWLIQLGDSVIVDIYAPGMTNRMRLSGRATRVVDKSRVIDRKETEGPSYAVELDIEQQTERPLRSMAPAPLESPPATSSVPLALLAMDDEEVSRTIDDLLADLIIPKAKTTGTRGPRRTHLSGLISQFPLTTLLSLFEMERMTGKLVVATREEKVNLFLCEGQLYDVEPVEEGSTPRNRLTALVGIADGAFEFYVQPVDRPNRIEMTTTALLIDISRIIDEANRPPDAPPAAAQPTGPSEPPEQPPADEVPPKDRED